MRAVLPVEFTLRALEDIEDVQSVARELARAPELGRIACGQGDPRVLSIALGKLRVLYRLESEQIVVLGAEPIARTLH